MHIGQTQTTESKTGFKLGDLVTHRGGGPTMTVNAFEESMSFTPVVVCLWFDNEEKLHKGNFAAEALELAPTAEAPAGPA